MRTFFIVLFILSAGQIASCSGIFRKGACLSRSKGTFSSNLLYHSIHRLAHIFSSDEISSEKPETRSVSGSSIARYAALTGLSLVSIYNANGQPQADQSITDLQTNVYISRPLAGVSLPKCGSCMPPEAGKLMNEKYLLIFNSKQK